MDDHVQATIDRLEGDKVALTGKLKTIDALIADLRRHFNGNGFEQYVRNDDAPRPKPPVKEQNPFEQQRGPALFTAPPAQKPSQDPATAPQIAPSPKYEAPQAGWGATRPEVPVDAHPRVPNLDLADRIGDGLPEVPAGVPRSWEPAGSNEGLTALSEGAVRIGASMQEPFTATDLKARLDGDSHTRAYSWIAEWKRKGWLATVSYGLYRRTERWGR